MKVLIVKLGATGDVVRTTPLLRRLTGEITWLTAPKNTALLQNLSANLHCLSWDQRDAVQNTAFDLVINLEDDIETGLFLRTLHFTRLFGAYVDSENTLRYSEDSREWFDLSLISSYGRVQADSLKLRNRRTYQDIIFGCLGFEFDGETYQLPAHTPTDLVADIAISPEAGPVWPMKNWAYYSQLKTELEARGLTVNVLPKRSSLLEHLGDVRNHRCLVGGDSLPMHLALGSGTRCVTLFTCTSPWEIHDYGLQTKIISPVLEEFFYKRGLDVRATTAIGVDEVMEAVIAKLNGAA
jgi:ADP-heptose:LPS heptosyltransferase